MIARLALARWVLRLVRLEWRQHLLVVVLSAVGIAAATVALSTTTRLQTPIARQFGDAEAIVEVFVFDDDPATRAHLMATATELARRFDDVDVLTIGVDPGGVDVSFIHQVGQGPYSGVWFDLIEGRFPDAGELALTQRGLERLEAALGVTLNLGDTYTIDGEAYPIVGRYENPTDFERAEALVGTDLATDPFMMVVLVPDQHHPVVAATHDALLVDSAVVDPAVVDPVPLGAEGGASPLSVQLQTRGSIDDGYVAVGKTVGATVISAQVGVLSAAGFAVLAGRRRGQLGLLAALGAEPRAVGSVLLYTGAILGGWGAVLGVVVGVGLSVVVTPFLSDQVDHRVGWVGLSVPWLVFLVGLGVLTTVAAAWWPSVRARREEIAVAMTGADAGTRFPLRVLAVALISLGAGGYLLAVGAARYHTLLIIAGVLAVVLGGLALAPAGTMVWGVLGRWAPLGVRVAWRDIARYSSRSAAAVAAAALGLALPFGVATFTASQAARWQPHVPDHVGHLRAGYVGPDGPDTAALLDRILAEIPGSRVVPVVAPVDRLATDEATRNTDAPWMDPLWTVEIQVRQGPTMTSANTTAIATPELLALMGMASPSAGVDLISRVPGTLVVAEDTTVVRDFTPRPLGYPDMLVVADRLDAGGRMIMSDDTVVREWFVVADHALDESERERLQVLATEAFHWFMFSNDPPPAGAIRVAAVAAGVLVGLTITAVAVVLIRIEARPQTRVLAAVGAAPGTNRMITAATATGLAASAAAIAVIGAAVVLIGIFTNPNETFVFVMPWFELAALLLGLPLLAGAVAWVTARPVPSTVLDW